MRLMSSLLCMGRLFSDEERPKCSVLQPLTHWPQLLRLIRYPYCLGKNVCVCVCVFVCAHVFVCVHVCVCVCVCVGGGGGGVACLHACMCALAMFVFGYATIVHAYVV